MIDKVAVTAGAEIPLDPEFEWRYRCVRKMPDAYYKEKAPLRALDIDAVILRHCRFNASQKLCAIGVSSMTIQDVAALVSRVFDCDPWELRLARIDFAIDLNNVDMHWIRAHARVRHKRWKDERGFDKPTNRVDQGRALYIGSGSDFFRFYDKSAELLSHTSSKAHESERSRSAGLLTRIERQLRTGRIPPSISNLKKLEANAAAFNPFAPLSFAPGGKVERGEGYCARQALEGAGMRAWIEQLGFARAWERLNKCSKCNAGRIVRRLADFIPPDPEGLELPDLFAIHRESLGFQLGESV